MTLHFRPLVEMQCRLGEGPVYDERSGILYFVDIAAHQLHALTLASGALRSFAFETEVACLGLAVSGRLDMALRHDVILFDPASGVRSLLATIEADHADLRLNDGKVGPDGAFWVGSINEGPDRQPTAGLYRVTAAGTVERKVEGLKASNGLAWTAGGESMFHSDSRGPWIDRWKFDRATGAIGWRTRIAEPGDEVGRPDGGACDAEGFYWSAGVSAGRLNRYGPDGRLAETHEVPVAFPTMPCFGGPDFRTLFLTSLREGRPEEALAQKPLTGTLVASPSSVSGFPPWRFLDG